MKNSLETKTTTRTRVRIDARVIAEFPYCNRYEWGSDMGIEKFRERLQQEVTEFEAFLRDHRSKDQVSLSVEIIEEEQCSACGKEWESMYYDEADFDGATAQEAHEAWEAAKGKAHCAWCGARLEETDGRG